MNPKLNAIVVMSLRVCGSWLAYYHVFELYGQLKVAFPFSKFTYFAHNMRKIKGYSEVRGFVIAIAGIAMTYTADKLERKL